MMMQSPVKTPASSNSNGGSIIRDKFGMETPEEGTKMKIFIRRVGEKTICVQGHKLTSYTICDVKVKLSKLVKGVAPPSIQRLYFAGMLLENDMRRTLSEYKIYGGCTLDLVCSRRGRRKIFVETITGKIIPLDDVFAYTPIREVKAMIQEKLQQAADDDSIKNLGGQKLVYGGEKLDDDRGLGYYYIQNESTLRLVDDDNSPLMEMEMMRIYVKIVANGKTIDLQVKSSDTIENVKAKIQEKEDIPADKQLLFLPQTRLKEGSTLAHYYIRNESTVDLIQIPN